MANQGKDSYYFRLPDLSWMALILSGLYLMVFSVYKPEWVPFDYLGPVGALSRYMANEHTQIAKGIMVAALGIHISYLFYVASLLRKTNLSSSTQFKWYLSTFIFGGTSLVHLRRYVYDTQHTD